MSTTKHSVQGEKVGNREGRSHICIPVQRVSALLERQPYCHTHVTSAGEAQNPAIPKAKWLRARLRPPWSVSSSSSSSSNNSSSHAVVV